MFAIILAIGQRVRSGRFEISFYLFLFSGLSLIHLNLFVTGLEADNPLLWVLNGLHIPLTYCLGPLVYLFLRIIFQNDLKLKQSFLHFLPAVILALILVPLYVYVLFHEEFTGITTPASFMGRLNEHAYTVAMIHLAVYLSVFYYRSIPFWNSRSFRRSPVILHLCLLCLFLLWVVIALVAAQLTGKKSLYQLAQLSTTAFFILVFILNQAYSNITVLLQKEAATLRYEKSNLGTVNVSQIIAKLKELMEREKLYLNEDLNRSELSKRLGLNGHQLSEILNVHMDQSYHDFLNSYRIEAARELIQQDHTRTILSVAYEVGFNSKSSFNTAFLKHSAETPSAYRKRLK